MADVEHSYYVYVISPSLANEQQPAAPPPPIAPIQKLTKHGQAQTISFLHFENDLYCVLGSNTIQEQRFVIL